MPRIAGQAIPKYCKHRATGQAVVTLFGRDVYLGPHGTKASKLEYDRLITEWLANGRQAPSKLTGDLTLAELIKRYRGHVVVHYTKNGRQTSEQHSIALALRPVRELYGNGFVGEFGPLALKAVRQKMLDAGHARTTINRGVHRIRRMFRWGVENELVAPSVLQALEAVAALQKGKTEARETEPVAPVSDATVDATLPCLPSVVADMVCFQRLTGCRPAEVCLIRPYDVNVTGDVWTYVPAEHNTEHRGKRRTIFIGPRAQGILRPYLLRDKEVYCFQPADSERKRLAVRHEARRVPLKYGNRPGTNRKRKPKRAAGERYDVPSYRRAITRACEKAFGMPMELRDAAGKILVQFPRGEQREAERRRRMQAATEWRAANCWSPNQLRHTAATELRKRFGLEAAQVVLGHSAADVTQIYAERDLEKAAAVIREVG
ncbi:MAG: site-specific integrase [Pirellulales bacterium]|nr:site-specific integrase [Pirellulales bacterium]